jgi:hypothetical protein
MQFLFQEILVYNYTILAYKYLWKFCCTPYLASQNQGSLFWLQNMEGEPLVGVFASNHQPEVLPPYFVARKENLVKMLP